jgi:autophagy-related protein 9
LVFVFKIYFLEELLSAFVTPLVLCFQLRRKSLQIIDFLRNFTVDVQGVGDVCSFAQLDVAKHGDLKVNFLIRLIIIRVFVFVSGLYQLLQN